jgi:hypothetical protein
MQIIQRRFSTWLFVAIIWCLSTASLQIHTLRHLPVLSSATDLTLSPDERLSGFAMVDAINADAGGTSYVGFSMWL